MSDQRTECPRCGQDWLYRVRLVALGRAAILCFECDALWLDDEDVGVRPQLDYGTYMKQSGRTDPEDSDEVQEMGFFLG